MEGHGVPPQTWAKSKESEIGLKEEAIRSATVALVLSERTVWNYLSLLGLAPEVQEMVKTRQTYLSRWK